MGSPLLVQSIYHPILEVRRYSIVVLFDLITIDYFPLSPIFRRMDCADVVSEAAPAAPAAPAQHLFDATLNDFVVMIARHMQLKEANMDREAQRALDAANEALASLNDIDPITGMKCRRSHRIRKIKSRPPPPPKPVTVVVRKRSSASRKRGGQIRHKVKK